MQLKKFVITLLGAITVVAALPMGERDVGLLRRIDSDVVVERAPLLSERQNNGNNSGSSCEPK